MFLVTGATGNVGRHVVDRLLEAGAKVRATSRNPATAGLPEQAEVVRGDAESWPLEGVTSVFLNPAALPDGPAALLGQAKAHGVRRIVLLSSSATLDPSNGIGAHHRELERQIEESGLEWTFVRPGAFASNTVRWAGQIRSDGVVRAPYGEAETAPIDERDIAAVAARALLADSSDGLVGGKPVLSGPESLSQIDMVRIIGEAIGTELRFEELAPDVARTQMLAQNYPEFVVDALLSYYSQAIGRQADISPAVEEITGQSARTFAQWAADHVSDFR